MHRTVVYNYLFDLSHFSNPANTFEYNTLTHFDIKAIWWKVLDQH